MFSDSLNIAFGTIWKNVTKYKTEKSSLNLMQENLIEINDFLCTSNHCFDLNLILQSCTFYQHGCSRDTRTKTYFRKPSIFISLKAILIYKCEYFFLGHLA